MDVLPPLIQAAALWLALFGYSSAAKNGPLVELFAAQWQLALIVFIFGCALALLYELLSRARWSLISEFEMRGSLLWLPSAIALFAVIGADSVSDRLFVLAGTAVFASGFAACALVLWLFRRSNESPR